MQTLNLPSAKPIQITWVTASPSNKTAFPVFKPEKLEQKSRVLSSSAPIAPKRHTRSAKQKLNQKKVSSQRKITQKHTIFPARPPAFQRIEINWNELEQLEKKKNLPSILASLSSDISSGNPLKQTSSEISTKNKLTPASVTNTKDQVPLEPQTMQLLKQSVNAYLQNISILDYYPRRALQKSWQGTVHLSLKFKGTGALSDFTISTSSDFKILDVAALKLIEEHQQRLSQYVQNSNWKSENLKEFYTLIFPVSFKVVE